MHCTALPRVSNIARVPSSCAAEQICRWESFAALGAVMGTAQDATVGSQCGPCLRHSRSMPFTLSRILAPFGFHLRVLLLDRHRCSRLFGQATLVFFFPSVLFILSVSAPEGRCARIIRSAAASAHALAQTCSLFELADRAYHLRHLLSPSASVASDSRPHSAERASLWSIRRSRSTERHPT